MPTALQKLKRAATPAAKKPAAKKTPARKPAATASGAPKDLIELTVDRLTPSPFNPRKAFDPAGIDELAASLKVDGRVFQNLVARKWTGKGKATHEIIAGERRYRAVSQLVEAGDWPADRPVPVLVIEADDAKVIELATVENVQRKDLTALEEARAFAQLRGLGRATDEIAAAVGMSLRHVQVALQLVDRLTDKAQEALDSGAISKAQARALVLEKRPERQDSILGSVLDPQYYEDEWTPDQIRERILEDTFPEATAIFPVEQYTGGFIVDQGDEDVRYFEDVAQFEHLQEAAITALEAELKERWAWVKRERGYFSSYEYHEATVKPLDDAGAVIEIGYDWTVKVHEGLVKRSYGSASHDIDDRISREWPSQPTFTKKHMSYAHDRKTEALQRAVMDSPHKAMVLTCVALLGQSSTVMLSCEAISGGGKPRPVYKDLAKRLDGFRPKLGFGKTDGAISSRSYLSQGLLSPEQDYSLYEAVKALSDEDLQTLFTCLIADRVGTFDGGDPRLGDTPLAVALARDLEIDMTETWAIDDDYLALCKKPPMREIFEAVSSSAEDPELAADRDSMTAKAMRNALSIRPVHVLPREMQFGSEEDLEKGKAINLAPPNTTRTAE